ncbi:MAG: dimethylsulfoniopropionate lyase [Tabrizicola sp.]|jgi:hypothetical protein|nr:dimethylsulfoniopropionate lyase [Tabrizicola sp.]
MTDPAALLHAPLGQPGSGRVRYAAAMELWRQGRISAEVLEVYRVASAHDGQNPAYLLQDRHLPVPSFPESTDALTRLYHAARDYVLALRHPGAAEVRAALPADPGPPRPTPGARNKVVDAWLHPALHAVTGAPALVEALAGAAGSLAWVTYDAYPRDRIGEAFATGHAYASILGEAAPFAARDVDLGVFLIAPNVLYRDHHHAAPELYAPLTGPHGWRFGPDRPLQVKPAHQPVWNPRHKPHLTKVGAVPFLCLFVWTGDVQQNARVLPANDWPALEELRLG